MTSSSGHCDTTRTEAADGAAQADDRVSIVIPTRNRRALLHRAVDSVRAQGHRNWELIVVDDASDDGSAESIRALGDARIRVVCNAQRRGGGYSRWLGAGLATGRWIAYLDDDDWWLPEKLQRQIETAQQLGGDDLVLFCPMGMAGAGRLVRGPSRWRPGLPMADFIYAGSGFALQTSGLMVAARLGRQVRFDPDLPVNQDTDFVLRLEAAGACFVYLHEALYVHDTSQRDDRISSNPALIEPSRRWFERVSANWSPRARRGYYLNDACLRLARAGRCREALIAYLRGIDLHAEPYYLVRQLFRLLSRGQVHTGVQRWFRRWVADG